MNVNIVKPEPDCSHCVDPSVNEDSGLAAAYELVLEQGDNFSELTPDSRTDASNSFNRSDSFSFEDSRPVLPPLAHSFLRQDSITPSSTLHYGASTAPLSCPSPSPINVASSFATTFDRYGPSLPPFAEILPEHDLPGMRHQWTTVGSGYGAEKAPPALEPAETLFTATTHAFLDTSTSVTNAASIPPAANRRRQPGKKAGTDHTVATTAKPAIRPLAIPRTTNGSNSVTSVSSTNSLVPVTGSGMTVSLCAICGDTASGRHYGVISCEGCKGFFKRSIRKQWQFTCRGSGQCPVDRSKRTRCQHCRFQQCLAKGMKREAVQEERHRYFHKDHKPQVSTSPNGGSTLANGTRPGVISLDELSAGLYTTRDGSVGSGSTSASNKKKTKTLSISPSQGGLDPVSSSNSSTEPVTVGPSSPPFTSIPPLSLTSLLTAELSTDAELPTTATGERVYVDIGDDGVDPLVVVCHSVEEQLTRLVCWARQLPIFTTPYFSVDDQFWLLRTAWPELLLISASFNSIAVQDGLLLANGRHLSRVKAKQHGLGPLMDRFLLELVSRFREMGLERIELALLRAIILFNPDANNLTVRHHVESVRESLYAGLHSYCTTTHPNDTSRFTKLLLRLPPLRSIAHKCLEHLVFVKLAAEDPSTRRLINLVEHGVWPSDDHAFLAQPMQPPIVDNNRHSAMTSMRPTWPTQGIHNHPVPGTLVPQSSATNTPVSSTATTNGLSYHHASNYPVE